MNRFINVLGILILLAVAGSLIFYFTASNETKKNFLKETGLDSNEDIRKSVSEIYVDCELISSRKNLLGDKWVINGRLYTTDPSLTYTAETVQFNFSDGSETVTFSYRLNGDQIFARPFQKRFGGHANADFYGLEVIDAR
ncbi:MAG: hypothetical protein HRT58_07715 [Crocinitomicaceae bacterium]|nr:hypothetical protein [Flavobacteriales bacterium]NQZ35537.1 hypothetical protein [Crocinitomicaceae bacterium]